MQRVDSLEKTLMLGRIGGRRKRGWQRMRCLDGITDLMDMSLSELREMVMDREPWHAAIHGIAKRWTQLRDWTELNKHKLISSVNQVLGTWIMEPKLKLFNILKCIPLLVFKLQKSLRARYHLMRDTKLPSYSCESPFLKKKKNQNFKPMKRLRFKSIFVTDFKQKSC